MRKAFHALKNGQMNDPFPEREQDRYISRGLAYIILLNGIAALVLVTALAFAPQSTADLTGLPGP